MDVYMYQAALYCEDCGMGIQSDLATKGPMPDVLDADAYPQGPYDSHMQEFDSPCHCDDCGEFLEVGLTDDGREYVKDSIETNPKGPVTQIWADYYELT